MIKAILFDLGNVLVRLNGYPFQPSWHTQAPEQLMADFMAMPSLHDYHCGRISEADFAQLVIDHLALNTSIEAFLAHFRTWPDQLLPNALEIVAQVNPTIKKAVFSNINDSHWPPVMQMGLAGKFDYYFASHKVNAAKPEPGIYKRALADMGLKAQQVLLVDDTKANIEMGKQLGIHAEQVVGTEQLTAVLSKYGLLSK